MRFVDADALIDTMEGHVTTMSVCSTTIEARAKGQMKQTCIADVVNAPTIDAIPVEWLREWQDEVETINEWWPIIDRIITVWREEQGAR